MSVVFDIQRYSIHDGPGIRTTAFFKGCPLSCSWCQNPESLSHEPQHLVYPSKCEDCGACPGSSVGGSEAVITYPPCPHNARETAGAYYSVQSLVQSSLRDAPFYGADGGVTFSGGEPLVQWDEVCEAAEALRGRGIHVALDSSGYAPSGIIRHVPSVFDLAIIDLKAVSPDVHKRFTGVENEGILANIEYLACAMENRLWLSVPVVPGVHDRRELDDMARYVSSLSHPPRVRILPYHRFGDGKYEALGLPPPEFDHERADDLAEIAHRIFIGASIEILPSPSA